MKKFLLPALVLAALAGPALAQTPATNTVPAAKPATVTTTAPITAPAATSPAKPAALIDINAASATELRALKGVGEARAEAIVKGRPYKGKDDLLTKKIVPENVFNDIKDQIVARQKN